MICIIISFIFIFILFFIGICVCFVCFDVNCYCLKVILRLDFIFFYSNCLRGDILVSGINMLKLLCLLCCLVKYLKYNC